MNSFRPSGAGRSAGLASYVRRIVLILETWKADLERSFNLARRDRPNLTHEEYLASTFYLQLLRMTEIGKEWQASLLREIDFCRAIGRYRLNAPLPEIVATLSAKLDLESTTPAAGGGFDQPLRQFLWLRRSESKAVEKEMAGPLQHDDCSSSVGGLATLRVYSDRLVLEGLSRQKYGFARKLLKRWLGNKIAFEAESIEDLAAMMAEREAPPATASSSSPSVSPWAIFANGGTSSAARRVPDSAPVPAHPAREALRKFYEDRYRKFPDQPVPMLENSTPREAARKNGLRPRLIELMKVHINGIEEVNRKEGLQLSLDWLLEELGIEELRARD